MGKLVLIVACIAIGYEVGFRDARKHPEHVVTRAVEQVRTTFGGRSANDVDEIMNKLEGKR